MLKTDSKKLETRDFISVGIFSLIYSVVAFVIGGVAQMTPVTFPFMPMIVALFTGTVFMLYVAKIPKKGALSILGVIAAILLFITGTCCSLCERDDGSEFCCCEGVVELGG